MLSDQELVKQYTTTGKDKYFAQIYIRHRQLVYQKCLFYVSNTDDAEDFVQDIFVQLTRKVYSYKGDAKFTTWLHSVTVNYCIDQLRKQQQNQAMWRNYQYDLLQMDDWAGSDEVYFQAFERVLNQLPPYQRDLLLAKYGERAPIKDIAFSQAITTSAVKMRIKRAREYARILYDRILAEGES
ncbi:RNA polymerase sigma factor [Spirosoma radiotolerans]|nr:RNA polymerase sigma factor [Spirosoma radiotolerans]